MGAYDVPLTEEEQNEIRLIAQATGVSEQRVIDSIIGDFLRPTGNVGYDLPPNGAQIRAKKGAKG